jgi:hypothetical protein
MADRFADFGPLKFRQWHSSAVLAAPALLFAAGSLLDALFRVYPLCSCSAASAIGRGVFGTFRGSCAK